MEYLMTYGWAILIIAVVLGALFQLGIFNANNFAVKAPPGSCQAYRPNGPGTPVQGLEGECTNALPQYVAQFGGTGYIQITSLIGAPVGNSQRTMTAWVYVPITNAYNGIVGYGEGVASLAFTAFADNAYGGTICIDAWGSSGQCGGGYNFPAGTWTFLAATYNGVTLEGYTAYGGQVSSFNAGSGPLNTISVSASTPFFIAFRTGTPSLVGSVSGVQLYNSSLSPAEVNALYSEGIGGAPVKPQNLVGWWPLNGNANDYSGNNNNGAPNTPGAVIYTSAWASQYTGPV